jgi:DNA replication protein DnaC
MENLDNSIKEMQESYNFRIRKFPAFTFGDKSFCEKILKAAILKVDETITEFQWLPEYDEIADYLHNTQGKGLLLAGDVGRGKTTIIHHVLPLIFYHFQKKIVKCTHANELKSHLNEYKSKLLISVDELGTEATANDFGNKYEPANNLFDMAESLSKIVFASTNLSSEFIINRYGIRTLDRITRLCKIVKFKGESLRK